METTPDLMGEEISEEVSSMESPPEETPSEETVSLHTTEEFQARVTRLMEMMESDPKVRDRLLAEIYVNIAQAEMGIRGMFEAMQSQGALGLMKGAFRRGG